jgi:hypothetical protein
VQSDEAYRPYFLSGKMNFTTTTNIARTFAVVVVIAAIKTESARLERLNRLNPWRRRRTAKPIIQHTERRERPFTIGSRSFFSSSLSLRTASLSTSIACTLAAFSGSGQSGEAASSRAGNGLILSRGRSGRGFDIYFMPKSYPAVPFAPRNVITYSPRARSFFGAKVNVRSATVVSVASIISFELSPTL